MSERIETLAEGVTQWVTIYALCEPIDKWKTGEVRYVGKTIRFPWHRVRAHAYAAMKPSPRLPIHRWLRKQIVAGQPFHIRHLERVPPGSDWAARERWWIEKFRTEGTRLFNLTAGGEGLSGLPMTAAHRRKIGEALRTGGHFACECCGTTFWRKQNQIRKKQNKYCSRLCSNRRGKP